MQRGCCYNLPVVDKMRQMKKKEEVKEKQKKEKMVLGLAKRNNWRKEVERPKEKEKNVRTAEVWLKWKKAVQLLNCEESMGKEKANKLKYTARHRKSGVEAESEAFDS